METDAAVGVNGSLPQTTTPNASERSSTSDSGSAELSVYAKSAVIVLYTVVTVVAVGGNATVCVIVATHQRMRTVTNYFIVSLACSDVLMATLCIPMTFISNVLVHYWPFGATLCPVVFYSQVMLTEIITPATRLCIFGLISRIPGLLYGFFLCFSFFLVFSYRFSFRFSFSVLEEEEEEDFA